MIFVSGAIIVLSNFCSFSMLATGLMRIIWICTSEILSIISLGPSSFGFFSSRIAGRSMIKMRAGIPRVKMAVIAVRSVVIVILGAILLNHNITISIA